MERKNKANIAWQIAFAMLLIWNSVAITLLVSNMTMRNALMPLAEDTLEYCEKDGVLDCHTEWKYSGLVLTGFDTIGREANHE